MFFTSLSFRLTAISLLLGLATEASNVFLPLYAQSLGASNLEVGLIATAYGLAFFFSSLFFGRQSDISGRLKFVRSGLGLSAIAYASQIITPNPTALLAARAFIGFCLGVTSAAVMAYAYETQKNVSSFVAYGALGWLFGAVAAAALRNYHALFLTSAIVSAIAFLFSMTLKEERVTRVEVALFPVSVLKANGKLYFGFLVRQMGANAIWAIFPLFLASLGAGQVWIALMDMLNMGGQFVAMRLVQRLNPASIFRAGLLMSAAAFGIYGIAGNYLQLVPVQFFVALAWSCIFIGAVSYLLIKNRERGTASGLLYSTMYLSAGIGPFAGGAISQLWGYAAVMYFGSGLALLGFFSSWGLTTRDKEKPA